MAVASGGDAIPYILFDIVAILTILITPWFKLNFKGSMIVIAIGLLAIFLGAYITMDIPFRENENKITAIAIITPLVIFFTSYGFIYKRLKVMRKS